MANKLTIQGEVMAFKHDKGGFSTSISNKNINGEYENMYVNLGFRKGQEPAGTGKINITNGFLTFRTNKEGVKSLLLMILDYIPIVDEGTYGADDSVSQEIAPELPF